MKSVNKLVYQILMMYNRLKNKQYVSYTIKLAVVIILCIY